MEGVTVRGGLDLGTSVVDRRMDVEACHLKGEGMSVSAHSFVLDRYKHVYGELSTMMDQQCQLCIFIRRVCSPLTHVARHNHRE